MTLEQYFSALPVNEMKKVINATERAIANAPANHDTNGLQEVVGVMIEIYQASK